MMNVAKCSLLISAMILVLFAPVCIIQAMEDEANRLFLEGIEADKAGKIPEAETKFQKALELFEKSKDQKRIADTLYRLARSRGALSHFKEAISLLKRAEKLHYALKDYKAVGDDLTEIARDQMLLGNLDESLQLCSKAMKIHEQSKNRPGIAATFLVIGGCYMDQGKLDSAIANAKHAYDIAIEIEDEEKKASSLMLLGSIHNYKGDHKQALVYLDQSSAIYQRLGKRNLLADVLVNSGSAYADLGDAAKSLEYYNSSGAIFKEVGDRYGIAVTSNNMGVSYWRLGEYGKALESFKKAYEIELSTGNKEGVAMGLSNIAYVLLELGDYESSLDHSMRALKIAEETGEKYLITSVLSGIATSYRELGKYADALKFFKRSYQLAIESGLKKSEAANLMSIGVMSWKSGDSKAAMEQLQKSASLFEEMEILNSIAENYLWIGKVHFSNGDLAASEQAFLKTIEVSKEIGDLTALWPALHQVGLVHRDMGKKEEALQEFKQSMEVIERSRKELRLAEQRTGFFESKVDVYSDLVSLLVSMGRVDEAFETVQRSKARGFIDMLAEAQIDPKQSELSPDLRERKKKLLSDLMIVHNLIQQETDKDKTDKIKLKALIERRNNLENLHTNLVLEIREQFPQYTNVQYPLPLQLSEAQGLLDEKTVLLEYYVRNSSALLFVVTKTGSNVFTLPDAQKLKEQITEFREVIMKPDSASDVTEHSYSRYAQLAHLLYMEVLAPAESVLKGKQRLILAPDRALSYLPFESLLVRKTKLSTIDFSALPYLARTYEIQYVQSASVLASILQRNEQQQQGSEKLLLGFADPQLESSDSEIAKTRTDQLGPLPYSRTELEGIADFYSSRQVTLLTGPDASEKNLKRIDLQLYRVLHFASHAFIDEEKPEFSALILSREPKDAEDGYLTMREVFDLKLNADLVVLSACKTGLGKESSGEGVNGISRAFMVAGTPSVIVSLWNAYDRTTADLMKAFYRNMKTAHLDKAMAMKTARIQMIKSGKYSHPYYWAPFILIGNR